MEITVDTCKVFIYVIFLKVKNKKEYGPGVKGVSLTLGLLIESSTP